jgi:hypothetical protein
MHTVAIYSVEDRLSAHRQKVYRDNSFRCHLTTHLSPMKHIWSGKVSHLSAHTWPRTTLSGLP